MQILGYAYNAELYCRFCGEKIAEQLADVTPLYLAGDSNHYPQPIFLFSDVEGQTCAQCGERLDE